MAALARDAARRDRNVDAMLWFQEAMAAAPERRAEWLWELAEQTLWAGQPDRAIPLLREVLAQESLRRHELRQARLHLALALSWNGQLEEALQEYEALLLEDPSDREALLGRGRVLSWLGRNGAAQETYVERVRQEPYDYAAHRALGQILSWRGRHRQAQSHLRGVLAARPDDAEAVRILARAQWWLGRPDRAMETLRAHLRTQPGDTPARDMLREFETAIRSITRLQQQESRQSDDLAIGISRFEQDFVFNQGLTTLGPRYEYQRYEPEAGSRLQVHRPGVHGRHRFSDGVEWTLLAHADWIELPDGTHRRLTYSTWLTLWPNDFVRFDIGSDRSTLDNVASLTRNIVATFVNLSTDVLPDERSRFVGRVNWGDYTDGNARLWGQVEAQRRWLRGPFLWAGVRSTAFHFRALLDHGYFNPRDYVAVDATMRLFEAQETGFRYALDGSAGYEHANPGGAKFIWSAGLRLDTSLSRHLDGGLFLSHFSSATASSSGFARTSFGAILRGLW